MLIYSLKEVAKVRGHQIKAHLGTTIAFVLMRIIFSSIITMQQRSVEESYLVLTPSKKMNAAFNKNFVKGSFKSKPPIESCRIVLNFNAN